jgi:hypothetical protein
LTRIKWRTNQKSKGLSLSDPLADPKECIAGMYEKTVRRFEAYKTIMDQDLIAALARMMRVNFRTDFD